MSAIGEKLKKERELKGFDLDEVFIKIKINPEVLKALEENRADSLIGFIYAKSFLKKYSNFLGLDGESLCKEYEQSHKERLKVLPIGKIILERPKGQKPKIPQKIFVIIVLFLIIGGGVLGAGLLIKKIKMALPKKKDSSSLVVEDATIPVSIAKKEKLILTIKTTDKVWVKVKSDNEVIFQSILPKNSKEFWQADDNFELWIGKPEVVKLNLNGRDLSLSKDKKIKGLRINHQGINF